MGRFWLLQSTEFRRAFAEAAGSEAAPAVVCGDRCVWPEYQYLFATKKGPGFPRALSVREVCLPNDVEPQRCDLFATRSETALDHLSVEAFLGQFRQIDADTQRVYYVRAGAAYTRTRGAVERTGPVDNNPLDILAGLGAGDAAVPVRDLVRVRTRRARRTVARTRAALPNHKTRAPSCRVYVVLRK